MRLQVEGGDTVVYPFACKCMRTFRIAQTRKIVYD